MRIGERGQVTIPKGLRDRYGLQPDTDVDFIDEGNCIRIVKRSDGAKRVAKLRGTIKLKGAASVDEYIEEIRGR
ncbi:MAG: AbrB/MazE/SpoVT family DNA-binding domain-containing protein [Armatimonadetes bacterium]|nr:AbrB/MazE/SpoVT family DNA-binding domain-containing protein [Armatimonadota bacterium]